MVETPEGNGATSISLHAETGWQMCSGVQNRSRNPADPKNLPRITAIMLIAGAESTKRNLMKVPARLVARESAGGLF